MEQLRDRDTAGRFGRAKSGLKVGFADLLLFLVPLLALFPLRNNDLWWHLATGRWIVAEWAVPRHDLFSHSGFLVGWVDNQWLSQLVLYSVWRLAGNTGLIVLRAALFTTLFVLVRLLLKRARQPSMFLPALVVGIALSYGWWATRPSVFSLVGMLVLLLVLDSVRRSGRNFVLLPVLFLLWANVHPGFFFGLLVLAGTTAALYAERLLAGWRRWSGDRTLAGRLTAWTGASALATLINPYGWRVFSQQLSIADNAVYRAALDEWVPPRAPFLLLALATVGLFLIMRFRRVPLPSLVPILGATVLSTTGVRFEEYFALVAVPALLCELGPVRWPDVKVIFLGFLLAGSLLVGLRSPMGDVPTEDTGRPAYVDRVEQRLEQRMRRNVLLLTGVLVLSLIPPSPRRFWQGRAPVLALAPAAVVLAAVASAVPTLTGAPPGQVESDRYPGKCLASIPRDGARGFNRLSWGGWLIWNTGVETYIDGRCWGGPIFFEYRRCSRPDWRAIFEDRGIDWAIVGRDDAVASRLSTAADWELTCRDGVADIYSRRRTPADR